MTSEPQQEAPEHDEPNDAGFAGAATTPTPERGTEESYGESIAVPAGDITGPLMEAIEHASDRHPDEDDEPGDRE
ncbi:hypothetical protein ACIA5C_27400 [Actinoplanes sp. NPDC051343]|jgi:hypothetical protein|uniref:hypothetical protein n=1 Tax=Actinoplanes sp. NPDC051343 TaxID=3363906 RepID=UPI0037B58D23